MMSSTRRPSRRPLLLLSLVLLSSLAAAQGVTVSDDLGREIRLDETPKRIVSLAPSHSESVCAVASCDLLVAVDSNTDFPEEIADLPRVGNAFAPDIEAIVALEPDLVLADEYSGVHEALQRLGVTVYAGTPQTVEETLAYFTTLGVIFDESERAAELSASIEASFEAVGEALEGVARPRVFIELDPTPYSAGPNSFIGTLLSRAGGDNIVTGDMGDFPQVAPEFVVASDPEIILLTDAPFGESAASVAARPGWASITAVREDQVLELSVEQVNLLTRAGPRLAEAVELLVTLLHPELRLPELP
ncbi:MAG TPA: ABC transporter substrate-binding protein [Trueperaceae bacterium]|nr:ABC transporter substrate-binding protein [Trueperaceae bacterium]